MSVVILFLHVSCIRFDDARKAASSFRSLPHWGRGTASAVDRVLSFILDLGRSSPLSFIPLEPYPARFARHLPHAGKALCRGYRFPHPTSAPSGHLLPMEGGSVHPSPFPWKGLPSAARRDWLPFLRRSRLLFAFSIGKGVVSRKPVFSFRCLPHWGRGTAPAVDRVLSQAAHLRRSFPLFFIPLVPYPARSARHLPHAGKALSVVILFLHIYPVFALTIWG